GGKGGWGRMRGGRRRKGAEGGWGRRGDTSALAAPSGVEDLGGNRKNRKARAWRGPPANEASLVRLRRAVPHRPLPRLRGRDREGARNMIDHSIDPLPNPPPQAGEGADRACHLHSIPFP